MTGYYGRLQLVEVHHSKRFGKCLLVETTEEGNLLSLVEEEELQSMIKLPGEPTALSGIFLDLLIYKFDTLPNVEFKYNSTEPDIVYLKDRDDDSTLAIVELDDSIRVISYCELDLSPVVKFLKFYGVVQYLKLMGPFDSENKEESEENLSEELESVDVDEDFGEIQNDKIVDSLNELLEDFEEEQDVIPEEIQEIEQLGVAEYLESRE